MKTKMELFLKFKYLLIVLFFGVLSVISLVNPGIPPTHDGEYHVLRFQQFYKVFSEGVFYPRWAPDFNNNYGIPLFNYVYPLPNYMASAFHLLGFSFINSLKLNMALASILGAVFFYLWSKKNWGEVGGVVSSIFYTFSPYHFLDVFVRGSVGEVWSLGLFPGLLWSYESFLHAKKKRYLFSSVIFLSLLIYSHNILALVFFSFFLLYALFLTIESKNKFIDMRNLFFIVLIGLGLAAPFWLPALLEAKYVVGLKTSLPLDHFPVLYKLIYSSWGYGFSGVGGAGQMSFQIGIANILVVMISFLSIFFVEKQKKVLFFLISFLIFTFLITPFSRAFWQYFPFSDFIQFPWRLLSIVIVIASFLAGGLVRDKIFKNKNKKNLIALVMILFCVSLSYRYAKAPFHHVRTDQYYLTRANFTDGTNSPGNAFNTVWLKSLPSKRDKKLELNQEASFKNLIVNSTKYTFTTSSEVDSRIIVNTAYFPGWQVKVDGKKQDVNEYRGKISFNLPSGKHQVVVFLGNTKVQNLSYLLFIFSLLVLLVISIKSIAIIKR